MMQPLTSTDMVCYLVLCGFNLSDNREELLSDHQVKKLSQQGEQCLVTRFPVGNAVTYGIVITENSDRTASPHISPHLC